MKKLSVTIQLEMSVPDDWELVQTSEGTSVLRLPGDRYLDLTVEPLFATDPEDLWSSTDDEDELDEVLQTVDSETVDYTFTAG